MPKRPCAVVLTSNDETVLVGDKFGDVYALPLLPMEKAKGEQSAQELPESKEPEAFQPSASQSTVHTKGNREALRQQQLQKAAVKKQDPIFENELVLGHVSLLTDLIVGVDSHNPARQFILTADRDEHIRVSRGIPQAHIIHSYCQGHTKFVSKLLIDSNSPGMLISAGGEPSLKAFDWLSGRLLAEFDLLGEVHSLLTTFPTQIADLRGDNFSVFCLQSQRIGTDHDQHGILLLVAFEG